VLVVVVVIAVAFAWVLPRQTTWLLAPQPTYAELIKDLGGEEVAAVLRHPNQTESVLLDPPAFDETRETHDFAAHNLKVASDITVVPDEIAADVSQTLLSPDQLREALPKSCIPVYGVRMSFFQKENRVDVYFCFECAILAIYLNDKPVGGHAFDFCYRRLMSDVRKIYPRNERLAKLAAERRH